MHLYVHIPFCRSKCEYCDFYSIPGARSRDLMERYLDAVILHIREAAQGAAGYEVDTVYFGGGTPSFFGAGGLAKIFAEIDRRFDVSRDAEVSLEANPDSVTLPMLMRLRRAKREDRLDTELRQIAKARLLIIDEFGYMPIDEEGSRFLFQVISDSYETRSVVYTTNIEFSGWGRVLGDKNMAAALIDRTVHHGRLVRFEGGSYRSEHALMTR